MLDNADNHCKIITGDDTVNKNSLNALINVNIDKPIALELMAEPHLEVRKFKSEKPLMDNCAVVKSKTGKLWNIPHKILERVEKV
jgi:hypothetical protein